MYCAHNTTGVFVVRGSKAINNRENIIYICCYTVTMNLHCTRIWIPHCSKKKRA